LDSDHHQATDYGKRHRLVDRSAPPRSSPDLWFRDKTGLILSVAQDLGDLLNKSKQEQTMAKKNTSSRKPTEESGIAVDEVSGDLSAAPESEMTAAPANETPPSKPSKAKPVEDPATGNVGLGDIRKAVAFANSVGGLDKALALLQIVKVAKEVQ
jgi:hypothetical protein